MIEKVVLRESLEWSPMLGGGVRHPGRGPWPLRGLQSLSHQGQGQPLNPQSSLDTDMVSHTETGKKAGNPEPDGERGGAETSPNPRSGQIPDRPLGELGLPGPLANSRP